MKTAASNPILVDANGQTIGSLVSIDFEGHTIVYLEPLNRLAYITISNGVLNPYNDKPIYYETTDCTLQAYIRHENAFFLALGGNNTFFSANGNTLVAGTFLSGKDSNGSCNPVLEITSFLPASQVVLPFNLPIAVPLTFK